MTNPQSLRALRLVEKQPEVADIYAAWKADIARINWSDTHIRGDRSKPVHIDQPRHKRRWL